MLCTCIFNSSNIDCFFESLQNLKITKPSICMTYTIYILGTCHVYTRYFYYEVLNENYAFLNISSLNIRLFSTMACFYSIRIQINSRKMNINILCIYMVYTTYILALGTYMVHTWYTWYIPCIIFLWVPDVHLESPATGNARHMPFILQSNESLVHMTGI
jgi:hypothetical protein